MQCLAVSVTTANALSSSADEDRGPWETQEEFCDWRNFELVTPLTSISSLPKMAKIKKKGQSGAAKAYMTRTAAVKKLQMSLADFRRLCILKGELYTFSRELNIISHM